MIDQHRYIVALPYQLVFIQPEKPTQEDVLDAYLFTTLYEAREITEEWIEEYNKLRLQEALDNLSPYQYTRENI
jgi:putative transposase